MIIEIEDPQNYLTSDNICFLHNCASMAQTIEGINKPLSVFLRITNDCEIQRINREYRNIDRSTDVLSFPLLKYPFGKTAGQVAELFDEVYDPDISAYMLGDIIISVDHVKLQAKEFGHSELRECCFLFTHALFHLLGYDHIEANDRTRMRYQEDRTMELVGLRRDG